MSQKVETETLPQHLHIALSAVATVHIGNGMEKIVYYLLVFSIRSAQRN
jgi:hypothetical protein